MEIETYEIEQAASEATAMAQDGAALELIESLGLEGQKRLLNPETGTRNPYRVMDDYEQTVYNAVLTEHVELNAYDADTIPLRVLQVAAHAKECGLFHKIEIWYAPPATLKDDPILVGYARKSSYESTLHILARWGKSLLPLEQLEAMAVNSLKKTRADQLRQIIAKATSRLAVVEAACSLEPLKSVPNYWD